MKIKNIIELIVFVYLAYIFLPQYTSVFFYILKFILYLIFLLIIMYYVDKGLNKIISYIKSNYINWYRKYHEAKHNSKKTFMSYGIVKQIITLIYLSIVNRTRYINYSKHFISSNKLATLFIFIFIILTFSIIYVLIF